ncbi:MAG: hypothetical protein IKX71_00055 [Bacteroidales bacterium]|nr:hypothetical protein [Bacteroidales bacterium]
MKKIGFASFVLLAVLLLAAACSVNEPEAPVSDSIIGKIVCTMEDFQLDEATKVTSTMTGKLISSTWDEGDVIAVFPSKGGDHVAFVVSDGAGTSNCVFDGQGWGLISSSSYSAFYPFHPNTHKPGEWKAVNVSYEGQAQSAKGVFSVGNFDYMACTNAAPVFSDSPSGTCTFTFKHLGSLLVFDLTFPIAADLSTLSLECDNNVFTKAGTVDLSQATAAITPTSKVNTVSMNLDGISVAANETVRFYMMSAPDTLVKPTLKVTTKSGAVMSKKYTSTYTLKTGGARAFTETFDMPPIPGHILTVSPTSFLLDYKSQTITFRVTSDGAYTLAPAVNWITKVSETAVSDTETDFVYKVGVNNVNSIRSGDITVNGVLYTRTVSVSQTGLTLKMPDTGDGLTIYTTTGNYKYRYGPSIIMNDDGTIDAWFSSPGTLGSRSGMADVFTWRRSSDGGQTWTAEQVVLEGTKNKEDAWSVCDPGAAHFDGYYYIAYTSTTNTTSDGGLQGLENNCYIARGTSPSGPWQKWSGTGWGNDPKPIIKYMDGSTHNGGPSGKWGIGEPSIVVKDDTIYIYYTYDAGSTPLTKVATASRSNPNWPGALTFHGVAINKEWLASEHDGLTSDQGLYKMYDSCDVKYVEDYDLFYAFHSSWRITASSRLSVWTSADGLTFTYLGSLQNKSFASIPWGYDVDDPDLIPFIHNVGVSGDGLGHVNLSKTQYVSFGYSPVDATDRSHGAWSTYWSTLTY